MRAFESGPEPNESRNSWRGSHDERAGSEEEEERTDRELKERTWQPSRKQNLNL